MTAQEFIRQFAICNVVFLMLGVLVGMLAFGWSLLKALLQDYREIKAEMAGRPFIEWARAEYRGIRAELAGKAANLGTKTAGERTALVQRSRVELWDLIKEYSRECELGHDRDIARAQDAIDAYLREPGDNSEVVHFWV